MAGYVDGIAEEWEANTHVREFVRANRSLFAPAIRCSLPLCNVRCGEQNLEQLLPLAKRLRMPNGEVGQIMVPQVQKESFI